MARSLRPQNAASPTGADAASTTSGRRTLGMALVGGMLTYLAHPPVGWSLLAWLGPVPWLMLVRMPRLPGRRPYRALWLAGAAFWLITIQWIRLPYWANIFGLIALAGYLGVYLPVFIGLSRVAVHRLHVPLWIAGPVVWTGLEWARARLLSGFLMASLAHTQVRYPRVIQIAELVGEYGVTFLIMLVAAAIAEALPLSWIEPQPMSEPGRPDSTELAEVRPRRPHRFAPLKLIPAIIALVVTLAYGHRRVADFSLASESNSSTATRIALIQSDMPADWKGTAERDERIMREQMELSREAVREADPPVDVVIWPETMYRYPLWTIDPEHGPPLHIIDQKVLQATPQGLAEKAKELGAALLVGIDRLNLLRADGRGGEINVGGRTLPYRVDPFNSSVAVDRAGKIVGTYDKMHVLPFGEYMPFADWLPFLEQFSPVTGVSLWGAGPAAFELDGVVYSPNICYETVLPHLIRQQVVELVRQDRTPDVLVNVTNDAWYWGSSELDMHLASGVFRAVEMRTPLVVAANRGLSAYVDAAGQVVAVTERNEPAKLVVDVKLPSRRDAYPSMYAKFGDWFSLTCFVCCGALAIVGLRKRGFAANRANQHE
jgi:apolipoprotein N-acyltransferase